MAQDPFPSDPFFLEAGRMVQFCPMCDAEFNPLNARVLSEFHHGSIMHVVCRGCRHAVVVLLATTPAGTTSFGFVTDASADDLMRVNGTDAITVDDVIDIHVQLEKGAQFTKELTNAV